MLSGKQLEETVQQTECGVEVCNEFVFAETQDKTRFSDSRISGQNDLEDAFCLVCYRLLRQPTHNKRQLDRAV